MRPASFTPGCNFRYEPGVVEEEHHNPSDEDHGHENHVHDKKGRHQLPSAVTHVGPMVTNSLLFWAQPPFRM